MSFWTDERKATVKTLWKDGLSARQIAEQVGAPSRSAVIGIVHRMGIQRSPAAREASIALGARARKSNGRETPIEKGKANPLGGKIGKLMAAAKGPRPAPVEVALPVRANAWVPLPGVPPLPRANATNRHCQWPITVGSDELSNCCGAAAADAPYCATHEQLAKPVQAAEKARVLDRSHARQIFGRAA